MADEIQACREADYARFKNYAALTFLVASPVLIALPPRKLDHLTVLLTGAFCVSANHVTHERTGRSIMNRLESRISRPPSLVSELPSERAQEIQARLRASREAQLRQGGLSKEEMEKLQARQLQDKPAAERLWMGGESEGWKEKRLREEQKALAEGKGYGDLIKEHIWDVWTWGEKGQSNGEGEGDTKNWLWVTVVGWIFVRYGPCKYSVWMAFKVYMFYFCCNTHQLSPLRKFKSSVNISASNKKQ